MSLINIINTSPLADDQKAMWIKRIETEGATPEVVSGVREALQAYIDGGFQTLGVDLDPDDQSVKAAYQKMEDEITAAESDFTEKMGDIEAEAGAVQQAISRDVDKVQANIVKAQI